MAFIYQVRDIHRSECQGLFYACNQSKRDQRLDEKYLWRDGTWHRTTCNRNHTVFSGYFSDKNELIALLQQHNISYEDRAKRRKPASVKGI